MPERPTAAPDRALLELLERAFAGHAGKDHRIDARELQRALGVRSEYLARRVLSLFDRNGDGVITQDEFVEGVRQLIFADWRDKLWFAFRLHDHDGDGFIDRTEMFRMISLCMAESEISERVTQPAEYLTRVLFQAADTNRDQRISFDEFAAALHGRPELLRQMTRSEATWLVPNEALLSWLEAPRPKRERGSRARGLAPFVVLALWVASNFGLLAYVLQRGLVAGGQDPAMQLGRALGVCIDFNGALILIPMLRRLLTRLRASALGRVLPIDDALAFHRLLGQTLFALALGHAACFSFAYLQGHPSASLAVLASSTRAGLTGGVLLGVFAVIWLFAQGFVRNSRHFELFYFTHLLYVLWFVLAVLHAPRFLLWAGVPLLGFAVEQLLRALRRAPSITLSVQALRSAVTRLEFARPPGFEFSPADYVFLRIPALARHEWHPFTLSSAPERERVTLHARALGNWTHALRRLAETAPELSLTAYLDGPYGSPSAHIFASRFAVLIGAGIGVTPFASVLESLVLRANGASNRPSRLERAYFFWLNRDQYSFEWFAALLAQLEELDRRGLLEIHLCMTGARAGATALGLELARDLMHASGRSDLITGLRTHTHVGFPDWEALLGRVAERHQPERVDVYFCGPPGLASKLEPLCRRLGMRFREEKF